MKKWILTILVLETLLSVLLTSLSLITPWYESKSESMYDPNAWFNIEVNISNTYYLDRFVSKSVSGDETGEKTYEYNTLGENKYNLFSYTKNVVLIILIFSILALIFSILTMSLKRIKLCTILTFIFSVFILFSAILIVFYFQNSRFIDGADSFWIENATIKIQGSTWKVNAGPSCSWYLMIAIAITSFISCLMNSIILFKNKNEACLKKVNK